MSLELIVFDDDDDHDAGGKLRLNLPPDVTSTAQYSDCRQYRYTLRREWEPEQIRRNVIMFLMCNPSTATEVVDDPTVRKCRKYASQWGYNTLLVGNIMAYRATDPSLLRGVDDPIGPHNAFHLDEMLSASQRLVCAWGRIPARLQEAEEIAKRLIKACNVTPYALRLNSSGGPWHPLYLPMAIEPQVWSI